MRNTMMAMILASMLVAPELPAATSKTPPPDVGPGRVAWFDITTTSLARSKEWQFNPVQGSDQAAEIVSGGTAIGTLRVADGTITPFDGVVYVQVTDILASCKKAKELGATIPPGFPFNLLDGTGAIAVIADPAGHPVGLYSRTPIAKPPSQGK